MVIWGRWEDGSNLLIRKIKLKMPHGILTLVWGCNTTRSRAKFS